MKKYILLLLFTTTLLNAASFDCQKASTKIEKAICANSDLSNLDSQLGDIYRELKVKIAQNQLSKKNTTQLRHFFLNTQRKWVKNRNKWCSKFKTDELKSCLDDHYRQRIDKLSFFNNDGSFIYADYGNLLYNYNHIPYMQTSFKELLDEEEYAKFLKEYNKWEDSYDICIDKYGVMQERCVVSVAKKKTAYYDKLLESYKNSKYLVEDTKVTLIKRTTKSYLKSYEESNEEYCFSYKYYSQSEYKKLFHRDINNTKVIEDIDFEKPNDENNLTSCSTDDSRFYSAQTQTIEYINKNVIVFKREYNSYSGGAHGDYESYYATVDRNNAEHIAWEDIFGKEKKLYNFIIENMRYIVMYRQSYKESDYYKMATSRMHITEDGIVIKFGIYEIASYDRGEPSFLIPLKLLKKTLSKQKYKYYFNKDKNVQLKVIYSSKK